MTTAPVPPPAAPRPVPWLDPAVLVATCGGVGRAGFAPGTFGAAVGLAAAALLSRLELAPWIEAAILLAVNLLGIPACGRAARLIGRDEDPGAVVYDEAASLPLALLVVPAAARSPVVLAAAFVLHRVFDIAKPPPCRRLERLPRGLGIMADDWGAAAYAASCLVIGRSMAWL